jgi:uncharacterized surface protein with fasciclin (FAS1) repeats
MFQQLLVLLLSLFCTKHVVSGQDLTLRMIIDADSNFATLGQALDTANIDLDLLAEGSPLTLFAPTNAAFSLLDPVLLERLLSTGWSTHLVIVLAMHLLVAAIPAESLVDGDYSALNGETLTVTTSGTSKVVSSPNTFAAIVTLPEIVATNGVFYEIDAVLLPTFVSFSVFDIAASDGFSILYELLVLTGLDQLLTPGITATVFAPNDDAFNSLGSAALDYYRANVDVTTLLLSGHVVTDLVVPSVTVDLGPIELPSAAGETLVFSLEEPSDTVFVYLVNGVQVIVPDVLANDGIVHVLNGVIAVPGTEVPTTPTTSPAPFVSPVDFPTASPGGMGMMEKKGMDKESKGMDKESKGMGGDGASKGMGGDGTSKGMGGDGASKGMGGDGTSKGMGGDGTSKGMGGDGTSKGMGGDGTSKGMGGDDASNGMGMSGESKGMGMSSL